MVNAAGDYAAKDNLNTLAGAVSSASGIFRSRRKYGNRPFQLYSAEVEFLRHASTLTSDGRLPFPEMVERGQ